MPSAYYPIAVGLILEYSMRIVFTAAVSFRRRIICKNELFQPTNAHVYNVYNRNQSENPCGMRD